MNFRTLLLSVCLLLPLAAAAGEAIHVQVPATLAPDAPITAAARRECDIPMLVGLHALQQLGERSGLPAVRLEAAEPAGERVLRLTVLSAYGVGGGGWSGPKSVMVRAQLVEDGKVLADRTLNRSSSGGVWGGVSGTCAIFERIAVALGKDVAGWLPSALRMPASVPKAPLPVVVEQDAPSGGQVR